MKTLVTLVITLLLCAAVSAEPVVIKGEEQPEKKVKYCSMYVDKCFIATKMYLDSSGCYWIYPQGDGSRAIVFCESFYFEPADENK